MLDTSYQANPPWAKTMSRSVCSGSTAASARWRPMSASAPRLTHSSSITQATTTSPAGGSAAIRSTATSAAAMPAFMSHVPRPYMRPSRTAGTKPSGAAPTTSVCPQNISDRPPPVPRSRPTTFGRPGATSHMSTSSPAACMRAATIAATAPSPAPPGSRPGFVESAATSCARSSAALMPSPRMTRARSGAPRAGSGAGSGDRPPGGPAAARRRCGRGRPPAG